MLLKDIRFAIRTLGNNPGYAALAMISLALGIGANSTIYSLADALLLRPLPVEDASRVVIVRGKTPQDVFEDVSYPDYRDIAAQSRAFDGLVAHRSHTVGFATTPDALPQLKAGFGVSANFFDVLRIKPHLGRTFRPEETKVPGRDAVLILGHDLWQQSFGGNTDVLGRKVRLNGVEFTIVGVTPESFTGMDQFFRPGFFVPLQMSGALSTSKQPHEFFEKRGARVLELHARLKPGVTAQQAETELSAIAANLTKAYPDTNRNFTFLVRSQVSHRMEQSPPDTMLVMLMMSITAVVLLIACANVANIMLSRARGRSREIAIRLSMGATRAQLIRQLLTESVMLSIGGMGIGLLIAVAGVQLLSAIRIPTDLPVMLKIELNERVVWFTLIAGIASALVSGLAPALQTTRTDLVSALKEGDQAESIRRRLMGHNVLVMSQVALSVILLVCASMMFRAFRQLIAGSPGFRTDHIAMMAFDPSLVRFDAQRAQKYLERVLDSSRQLPGVRSAALATVIPFGNNQQLEFVVPEGYQLPQNQETVGVMASTVSEGFFDTMQVRLAQGRAFLETDNATAPKVAIVNEEFAKRYWPNQNPVGKRFRLGNAKGDWLQVIGVTETGKYLWIAEAPTPFLYLPYRQNPRSRMRLLVHTASPSAAMIAPIREAARALDPNQPIYDVRTMEEFYDMRAVKITALIAQVVGIAGLMGLALALTGLYGLISYSVSRRTREIGIRMAIGSGRDGVLRMVLRQGMTLASIGLLVGMLGGIGVGFVLKAAFQMDAVDWVTMAVVPVLLLAVTALATLIPARRAAMIDPMRALRWE
ncbi:MAG: ABC transporter permease [Bryobacterales bacterium]|nr:ABC transporter permease [Bryobacterales bacterium]